MASAEEIGECAAWLCLDASPYLTGATITVDGGLTVRG
jgi:NAD(P)-dependent dehydrogenase (short-subunit alcohol dehydrogenase family)